MEFETPEDTMVAGLLPLANASQQPYVSKLLSFTLDRLHKEPELLRVDAERIRRKMQEVAVGNYGEFSIREEVSAVDKHLEYLDKLIGELLAHGPSHDGAYLTVEKWVRPFLGVPPDRMGKLLDVSSGDLGSPTYALQNPLGVSAAMNELRPCAPVSLKHILAQEVFKGLRAVSETLMRYNSTRVLQENESTLFISLCRVFIEVAFPHCATCFGCCYPGWAALITELKNIFGGLSRLLEVTPVRGVPKPTIDNTEGTHITENGGKLAVDNNDERMDHTDVEEMVVANGQATVQAETQGDV